MPTYEYECNNCKYHFEVLQGINEPKIKKCPKCGGSMRKLISGSAGLIFKGSGFYITDYKKPSLPKEEKKSGLKKPEEKPAIAHKKDQ
uniref:Zinc ribbon domain-containing protein n=1 Tax=candidate division WOR-3 bacterium TaxID=2052148 RepID=A0A7V0Z6M3_UNCW3